MTEIKTFKDLMEDNDVRSLLAIPRRVPRKNREEIARILFNDIFKGKSYDIKDDERFIEKYGAYYLLYSSIRSTEEWRRIRKTAATSNIAALIVFKSVIVKVLDLLEKFASFKPEIEKDIPEDMKEILSSFEAVLEDTLELWNRNISGHIPRISDRVYDIDNIQTEDIFSNIYRFRELPGSQKLVSKVAKNRLLDPMLRYIREMDEHIASLELLTSLYPGRGWDYSIVELHRTYLGELQKYSKILERNKDVRKILELLGRIELEKGPRRTGLSSFSKSEVYSVTMSNRLEYILPAELVKLEDETLKTLFFANWMEGKLLTYQLRNKEWSETGGSSRVRRKGPVVALVDTSGSMKGAPEIIAKSIILAVVRQMLREKRDVKVFLFSSIDQTTEIDLTDRRRMAPDFLDFLTYVFEGGTDFNTALKAGIKTIRSKAYRNSDLLFITDGISAVTDESLVEEWNDLREKTCARIYTIIVGNNTAGGLEELSDYTYILNKEEDWSRNNSPSSILKLISQK